MKPFKGKITNVRKIDYGQCEMTEGTLGYLYMCTFIDHPRFANRYGHTSLVMFEGEPDPTDGSIPIETLNSRYRIIPAPV